MVSGTRSADQVLKAARKAAKSLGYTVSKLPKRGKGSHTIWAVLDQDGNEVGRVALTGHSGQMTKIVTRSNEKSLEGIFGEGWLDK
ncbi:hypothetical protein [Occultella kanbiaonis]|uniref:hypothetical protein n=1 Tax=Occultella kanbiaonis TaxID=2675754 RepID=UPI0013CFAB64|nr:hypothetical protein [Occultella kanbiaonis]